MSPMVVSPNLQMLPSMPLPILLLHAARSPLNQVSVRGSRQQKVRSRMMFLSPMASMSYSIRPRMLNYDTC